MKNLAYELVLVLNPSRQTPLPRRNFLAKMHGQICTFLGVFQQVVDFVSACGSVKDVLTIPFAVSEQVIRPRREEIRPRSTVCVKKRASLPFLSGWQAQKVHYGGSDVDQTSYASA